MQLLDALACGARVPLILGARPRGVSDEDLASRHVRICLAGNQPYFDAVAATYRRLLMQRSGHEPGPIEPKALIGQLSHAERYAHWVKEFLN